MALGFSLGASEWFARRASAERRFDGPWVGLSVRSLSQRGADGLPGRRGFARFRHGLPAAADESGGPGAVRRRGLLRQVGAGWTP